LFCKKKGLSIIRASAIWWAFVKKALPRLGEATELECLFRVPLLSLDQPGRWILTTA